MSNVYILTASEWNKDKIKGFFFSEGYNNKDFSYRVAAGNTWHDCTIQEQGKLQLLHNVLGGVELRGESYANLKW
jgi:hypothetical protein